MRVITVRTIDLADYGDETQDPVLTVTARNGEDLHLLLTMEQVRQLADAALTLLRAGDESDK